MMHGQKNIKLIIVAVERQCVTYSECTSVAIGIQHINRMRHIILPSVACRAVPYSPALSNKWYDIMKNKKVMEHKMCILIPSTLFVRAVANCTNSSKRCYHKCSSVFM
jgi:ABC-type arginine transport system permease subunit